MLQPDCMNALGRAGRASWYEVKWGLVASLRVWWLQMTEECTNAGTRRER